MTNDYMETLYPNIYATGAAVNTLFGNFEKLKVDYSIVAWRCSPIRKSLAWDSIWHECCTITRGDKNE